MIRNLFFDLDGTLIRFPTLTQRLGMLFNSGRCLKEELQETRVSELHLARIISQAQARVFRERSSSSLKKSELTVGELWVDYISQTLSAFSKTPDLKQRIENAQRTFYLREFPKVCQNIVVYKKMCELVRRSSAEGIKVHLATNPISSLVGIETRLANSKLSKQDFELVTSAEGMHYLKPSLHYYSQTLELAGVKAEESLMIGDDPSKDAVAKKIGMKTVIVSPRFSEKLSTMRIKKCLGM